MKLTDSHLKKVRVLWCRARNSKIGHFRVDFCLFFKTSLSAKLFIWKLVSLACLFSCKSNSFSFEWFRTWTRFETEAKDNSEMAYSCDVNFCFGKGDIYLFTVPDICVLSGCSITNINCCSCVFKTILATQVSRSGVTSHQSLIARSTSLGEAEAQTFVLKKWQNQKIIFAYLFTLYADSKTMTQETQRLVQKCNF